jgi:hypothetical protein
MRSSGSLSTISRLPDSLNRATSAASSITRPMPTAKSFACPQHRLKRPAPNFDGNANASSDSYTSSTFVTKPFNSTASFCPNRFASDSRSLRQVPSPARRSLAWMFPAHHRERFNGVPLAFFRHKDPHAAKHEFGISNAASAFVPARVSLHSATRNIYALVHDGNSLSRNPRICQVLRDLFAVCHEAFDCAEPRLRNQVFSRREPLFFAKILCALKIARFPPPTAARSSLSLHPRGPRISPGGAPGRYTCIYKDGRTRTFSRRYVGSD